MVTESEKKELLEWFGFRESKKYANTWVSPSGVVYLGEWPEITLGNLFRWTILKIRNSLTEALAKMVLRLIRRETRGEKEG